MVTCQFSGSHTRRRAGVAALLAFWFALYPVLARADQDTGSAIRRCSELVAAFDEHASNLRSQVQRTPDGTLGVRMDWTSGEADHAEDWIICWFLPLGETNGIWQIDQLQTK